MKTTAWSHQGLFCVADEELGVFAPETVCEMRLRWYVCKPASKNKTKQKKPLFFFISPDLWHFSNSWV